MNNLTDKERADVLGISLDKFRCLVGSDIDPKYYINTTASTTMDTKYIAPFGDGDAVVPVKRGQPSLNTVYDSKNVEIYWDKHPTTEEEMALFSGYHIHSKDNPYGLHTHVSGGKLSGSHKHSPQNRLGYHTHSINILELQTDQLLSFMSGPIQIDGPHEHLDNHADGPHTHAPHTFG